MSLERGERTPNGANGSAARPDGATVPTNRMAGNPSPRAFSTLRGVDEGYARASHTVAIVPERPGYHHDYTPSNVQRSSNCPRGMNHSRDAQHRLGGNGQHSRLQCKNWDGRHHYNSPVDRGYGRGWGHDHPLHGGGATKREGSWNRDFGRSFRPYYNHPNDARGYPQESFAKNVRFGSDVKNDRSLDRPVDYPLGRPLDQPLNRPLDQPLDRILPAKRPKWENAIQSCPIKKSKAWPNFTDAGAKFYDTSIANDTQVRHVRHSIRQVKEETGKSQVSNDDEPGLKSCLKKSHRFHRQSGGVFNPGRSSYRTANYQVKMKVEENHRNSDNVPRIKACSRRNTEKRDVIEGNFPNRKEPNTAAKSDMMAYNSRSSCGQKTASDEMGVGQKNMHFATNAKKTQVIFAIDFSTSMNKEDVKTANGNISRWEAVFECIDSFLSQQLQNQRLQQSDTMSTCLVSVLTFNDSSRMILKHTPLTGEGGEIRKALKRAHVELTPKGGTGFSAGFREAEQLARSLDDKVILVFLSDGRPGDLSPNPPSEPSSPMQTTFKRMGVVHPAAGYYIESMQKRHNDFNLQLICLSNEGVHWMKYLANRYNGTFHNPDLTLDDAAIPFQPHPKEDSGSDTKEDEVVEVVKVKSQTTLISERHKRAETAGDIVSLTNMSTTNASSIRSTFSSISATVTAMRSTTKLQERAVTIKEESPMISCRATRMVFTEDANGVDKFTVAMGESANERQIKVSMHPFAQGGLRNVYHMKQKSEKGQVAKESRHDIKWNERLKFHLETAKCQVQASKCASLFNKEITSAKSKKQQGQGTHSITDVPLIDVLCAEVYRLKAPRCPGGFRYLAVEQYLEGKYEKWNNNNGFVNKSDCMKCKVAQAFSHFTYERSNQQKMVVDIQGSGYVYTDPQLHSIKREFGRADRGGAGMDIFFTTHKCNFICKELGLPHRSPSISEIEDK